MPAFGELTLTELKRKHVWDWAASQPEASAKTTRNTLSPLRIALHIAVEQELIPVNPLIGFKVRRRDKSEREEVDPFTTQERAAILSTMTGQGYNMTQFAFWTGLRTSQLIALDWTDIDWQREVAVITKTFTAGMVTPERSTKTVAGRREVKLLGPALEALNAQKQHTYLKGAEVFQNPKTGERWQGDQAIRRGMWAVALRKAGVRYRKPYQTRHTYASMMLVAGENVLWVAAQMGHTDWSLTAKRYGRWIPADMPSAGAKAVAMSGTDLVSLRSVRPINH